MRTLATSGIRTFLFGTTALAVSLCLATQTARAQSVKVDDVDNDVTPFPSPNPLPSWIAVGNLYVGDTSKGRLTIEDGGTVESANGVIGFNTGSEGAVSVSGTGCIWTNSGILMVGMSGKARLAIEDGGTVESGIGAIGLDPEADSSVIVSGAGSIWKNSDMLLVGGQGKSSLTITDGGAVENTFGAIGNGSGSESTVNVSGAGSIWKNSDVLLVGNWSKSRLTIEDGGTVENMIGYIGVNSVSEGSVSVSGAGSTWKNNDSLVVGARGEGALTVAQGGIVSANGGSGAVDLGTGQFGRGVLNIGAALGETATTAGFVQAADIRFGNGNGTLDFNHAGATTFSAALTSTGIGTHAMNHAAGTTTLTGDSTGFTGTTTVSGGTLLVGDASGNGALGGIVNVGANGTLGGSGVIGSAGSTVTITAGGTHAPGNSIGVQTVAGNYTNHGTLAIEATPATADRLTVQGPVDISGATLAVSRTPLAIAGWMPLNAPHIILDNRGAGAVTGTFANVTSNLLFLDETVDYAGGDGNDITLELTRNSTSFADVGRTRNQRETGAGAETLPMTNAIWQAIIGMTDADMARASLDSLSGEVHPSLQGVLNQRSAFLRNAANDRIRAAFATSGEISQELSHGLAFWSEAYGAWADFDSDGNATAMDLSSGGVFVGADALAGNWRFGLLGGYGQSKLDVAKVASSAESKDYHLGLYTGTELGRLGIRTGAGYSWHSIDTARNVQAGAFTDSLSANYDASTFQAFGEMSYRFDLSSARLEPFVNLAYVHQSSEGFTEKGGAAALTVNGQPMDTGYATIGARMEHAFQLDTVKATAKATLGWQMAFGDTNPTSVHSFAGSSDFAIAGVPIARNAALIEAGVDVDLTPKSTLGLSYRGQIAENARQHEINGMLSIRF